MDAHNSLAVHCFARGFDRAAAALEKWLKSEANYEVFFEKCLPPIKFSIVINNEPFFAPSQTDVSLIHVYYGRPQVLFMSK